MQIKEYLISVTATAIVCCCFTKIFDNTNIIKVLCGIFLSLSIISPLLKLDIGDSMPELQVISQDADNIIGAAQMDSATYQQAIIIESCEAYICDKAKDLGCDISVIVDLADSEPYEPDCVTIKGNISPYAKSQISKIIESDLGVCAEEQQWE